MVEYVEPHQCEINSLQWTGGPIAVLVTDAPKRVPEISSIMIKLRNDLVPGSIMAWQDFCHFPSYDIPACLYRMGDHIEFVAAVVPGTTMAFRVVSQWGAKDVSPEALALDLWTPAEILRVWDHWLEFVPAEKASLFRCGAAMFMCDIGARDEAVAALRAVFEEDPEAILPKWQYLHRVRPAFVKRYKPLFEYLAKHI